MFSVSAAALLTIVFVSTWSVRDTEVDNGGDELELEASDVGRCCCDPFWKAHFEDPSTERCFASDKEKIVLAAPDSDQEQDEGSLGLVFRKLPPELQVAPRSKWKYECRDKEEYFYTDGCNKDIPGAVCKTTRTSSLSGGAHPRMTHRSKTVCTCKTTCDQRCNPHKCKHEVHKPIACVEGQNLYQTGGYQNGDDIAISGICIKDEKLKTTLFGKKTCPAGGFHSLRNSLGFTYGHCKCYGHLEVYHSEVFGYHYAKVRHDEGGPCN